MITPINKFIRSNMKNDCGSKCENWSGVSLAFRLMQQNFTKPTTRITLLTIREIIYGKR